MAAVYFSTADIPIDISIAVNRHVGFACSNEKWLKEAFQITSMGLSQLIKVWSTLYGPFCAVKLVRARSNK